MGTTDNPSSNSTAPGPARQNDQSGGVNIFGGTNHVQGDIVGRDKTVYSQVEGMSAEAFRELFMPLVESVKQSSPEKQIEAEQKVESLKEELAKGKQADDGRVAKLLDGIVELVPGAVSAVISMFANPILGGLVGPVTKFVLEKITKK